MFVDESGDTGLKVKEGSSRYFVISLLLFEEHDEAVACDQRIELLKRELKHPTGFEFKFGKLNKSDRLAFIQATLPYSYFYFGVVIDKSQYSTWPTTQGSFYKYVCDLAFQVTKPLLKDAVVIIDGRGSREFRREFKTFLRKVAGRGIVKKVKIQDSHRNNLIQMADMVAGVIQRSYSTKSDKEIYRKAWGAKEMKVETWPK